ncbi:MAG: hypothetical protein M3361_12040, partial [Candidatus Tectomicrobia bacterium]|nr:hypothetical protein [Candidatus Tectomicrobia bacterium]
LRLMAVVTANFVKRGKIGNAKVKATIRYIQHRPGKDHERLIRPLFGSDGPMQRLEAYQLIDEAPKGTVFFRVVINPDPEKEDRLRDLDMRQVAQMTMQSIEARVRTPVIWAAAVHDDHTDKRHIHALAAVQGRLDKPDLDYLIESTTQACLEQRRERDQVLEKQQGEREQEWEVEWER